MTRLNSKITRVIPIAALKNVPPEIKRDLVVELEPEGYITIREYRGRKNNVLRKSIIELYAPQYEMPFVKELNYNEERPERDREVLHDE